MVFYNNYFHLEFTIKLSDFKITKMIQVIFTIIITITLFQNDR